MIAMPNPLNLVAIAFALLALLFFIAAFRALRRRRVLRVSAHVVLALLFIAMATLSGGIALATHGYRTLTREDTVALVRIEPLSPQRFTAKFRFPDGRVQSFTLAGDEVYVDAHILKWHPLANFIGLHTAYELDRVAGRYRALADEQSATRTVFSLASAKPIDLFDLRQRYAVLAPLLDAEYGSGTFVAADRAQEYEILVSTTGLLVRPGK